MAKPVKFAHVVYMTRRYDEMIAWYRHVFEAEVVSQNPALAFLTYDEEHHRFAFANLDLLRPDGGDKDARGQIGVNHVAYTYATVEDLLYTYARLRDAEIRPYWSIHHGTTLSNYYRDPDGNRMELQVDVGKAEEALAYMESAAFADNPVGVEVDPEELLIRLERGADAASLLVLPDGPPASIPALHGLN